MGTLITLAHASPVRFQPAGGAVVAPGLTTLRVELTQAVEVAFSRLEVRSGGKVVSQSATLRQEGQNALLLTLPPLDPGEYEVAWRLLATDGHRTEGSYAFSVAVGGEQMTAVSLPASGDAVPWLRQESQVALLAVLFLALAVLLAGLVAWRRVQVANR